METATRPDSSVRFENFELNLLTRELYRNGRRINVHGHPLEVLAILIEHPGELVTRGTLQKRIWPENTFVDFEHSLNNSVGKLRDALGDRSENPRYIETLPRLGYRFVAHVQNDSSEQQLPHVSDQKETNTAPEPEISVTSLPARRWRRRFIIATVSFVLFCLSVSAYWISRRYSRPSSVSHRIVVLPLVNTSLDVKDDSFADGMTERLITELSQFNAWEVISRTSAMHYKGSKESLPKIAHELSADLVVEGTVQRSGEQVRITAQLIDASRDVHLWSGAFQRDMTEVLALQAEIARAIADRTDLALTPREKARIQYPHKVVPEAYDAFLTGMFLFELGNFQQAADYFEKATIADPKFALAFAYLAESDGMWSWSTGRPWTDRKIRAGDRAIELDPNMAESHVVLGERKFFLNWDWAGSEAEFRKALELDPHSESAQIHLGGTLIALRRWDESIAVYKHALLVNPFSHQLQLNLFAVFVDAHRSEEALAQFKEAVKIAPEDAGELYLLLGYMHEGLGRYQDAVAAYLESDKRSGFTAENLDLLQRAFRSGGIHGYWRKVYELQASKAASMPIFDRAALCVRAGENDEAMRLIEQIYREHNPRTAYLASSIAFDPIRSDPRFQDVLRRLNFPEPPSNQDGRGM